MINGRDENIDYTKCTFGGLMMVMQLVSSTRKFSLQVNSLELAMDLDLGTVIKFNYLFGFGDA